MSGTGAERMERFRQAIRAAMEAPLEHDSCGDCGQENELDWRPEEREIVLAYAVMAVADEEHARLSAESQQAIAVAAEAVKRQRERAEAAEAEVKRLRISPDHLEEMLDIDPNDPLNKLARYGVEQRRRGEDAEAALAKVAELHRRVEGEHFDYCAECDEREEWPCPTAAALQADDAALMTLAEARVSTDDGVRHDLDDVAREFGVTE